MRGLLFITGDIPTNGIWGELVCFKHNNTTVYHNPQFTNCYPLPLGNTEFEYETNTSVKLYPNPSNTHLTIKIISPSKEIELLTIYDINGRSVYERAGLTTTDITINTSSLNEGIYSVVIKTRGNHHYLEKLFVNR
jgi:hypothetical protein